MDSGESSDILPARRHVTPVELNQTTFGRAVRGYDPEEVDALLAKVRESYSELYKERLELAVEVRTLEDEINRLDADQNLIREVLVEAKRTADELRADGARDADLIRQDARQQAAGIVAEAEQEIVGLGEEILRLRDLDRDMRAGYRAFLLAALELVESTGPATGGAERSGGADAAPQPVSTGDDGDGAVRPPETPELTPLSSLEAARRAS
jgi:cell division initiation protein